MYGNMALILVNESYKPKKALPEGKASCETIYCLLGRNRVSYICCIGICIVTGTGCNFIIRCKSLY